MRMVFLQFLLCLTYFPLPEHIPFLTVVALAYTCKSSAKIQKTKLCCSVKESLTRNQVMLFDVFRRLLYFFEKRRNALGLGGYREIMLPMLFVLKYINIKCFSFFLRTYMLKAKVTCLFLVPVMLEKKNRNSYFCFVGICVVTQNQMVIN